MPLTLLISYSKAKDLCNKWGLTFIMPGHGDFYVPGSLPLLFLRQEAKLC
ncbi:MAG: hypothetical protein HOE85_15410 [Nitrospinaceae bacterium]|jgi:hypothetical protein|nr:hypothetical protein [Nitrospinaceae bacterium]MBT4095349.1 hypothetical protein [Nitrospinaceae bacterium]MBT5948877.1 hypothetical protein [Nitrospinaceae bacterium]MBT7858090.1 hypothetical protein [Nitrospinaceae bacterium]